MFRTTDQTGAVLLLIFPARSVSMHHVPRRTRTTRLTSLAVAASAVTLISSPSASAQQAITVEAAALVRERFVTDLDAIQGKFLALAEAFPAEMYSWRPAPEVRSVGEVFMHVANEFYVYVPMTYGATPSPLIEQNREGMQKFEATSTKAEVLKHLPESFAYSKQALAGVSPAAIAGTPNLFGRDRTIVEASFITIGELHEHLGQLIAYARVNGIRPPWSQ